MMPVCRARRCGHVVLSAESAERPTIHHCQSLNVTWLLCHPDLSGSRIDDLYLPLRVTSSHLSPEGKVCRLRLGRLMAAGQGRLHWAIGDANGHLGLAADQSAECLGDEEGGPIAPGPTAGNRYGWLLEAIGRTFAQLGPAAAQSAHPCLERLLSLG